MDSVIPSARRRAPSIHSSKPRRKPPVVDHSRSELRAAVMREIVSEYGRPPRDVHVADHPAYVAAMLYARYTGQPRLTLEEIGILEGVSRERVRQIEDKALNHCFMNFAKESMS